MINLKDLIGDSRNKKKNICDLKISFVSLIIKYVVPDMSSHSKSKDNIIREIEDLKKKIAVLESLQNLDATAHALTKSSLNLSNEFNNSLLHAIPFGIVIVDKDGTILLINDTFKNILGVQGVGQKCWELYCDHTLQGAQCPLLKGISVGETKTLEVPRLMGGKIFQIVHTGINYNGEEAILEIFIDITEQSGLLETLGKSETRFKAIFEDAPLGVALIDSLTGRIYEVNQKFANIAGRTIAEMASIDWLRITHPDDIQEDLDNMELLIKGEINGFQMEKRYIRPDNSIVWINMTISRILKEPGKPMVHLCMIEDITERKHADEAVKRHAGLLDLAHDSLIVSDMDSRITYWNKGAAERYGWTSAEVIGKKTHELLHTLFPIPRDEIKAGIFRTHYWEGELIHTTKSGSQIVVSSRWQLQLDSNNDPIAIFEINNDITERKKAEEANRQIEARFRSAFDLPLIGFAITSLDKGWMEVNSALLKMLGYSLSELKNLTWADLTYPDDLLLDEVQFNRVMAGEIDSYVLEKRYLRKDGQIIWTLMSAGCIRKLDYSVDYFIALIQDISDQKRAQQLLSESEEKYRTLAEKSNDLIIRFDRELRYLYVNPAVVNYFGIVPEQFIGKTHQELGFAKADYEYWEQKIEQVFITALPAREVTEINQGETFVEWDLIPEFDTVGNVSSVLSYSKDITTIVKARNALEESEAKYRVIFANNPNPMVIYDIETLFFLEVNQAAIDLYGYTHEEFLAMTILDIRPEEDKILVMEDIKNRDNSKNDIQKRDTWRHLKKNGELIFAEVSAHSLTVAGKEARHVLINDITRRKQLEEALLSKSSLLEAQLNSVTEGILVIDEHNIRILNNKRYLEIFDVPKTLLDYNDHFAVLDYIPGLTKNPELFIEKVNYLNGHPLEKSVDEIELRSGKIIYRYSAPVLGNDGEYFGRIWSYRDITDLKNAELEIVNKNVELQKVISDKDKFYSIIAHDLRGPIGGIAGMTELMADPAESFSEEERKELITELNESARNSFNLLEQLLEWSRMESGTIHFNRQKLDLYYIVDLSLKMLSKSAIEKGVEIVVDIPGEVKVFADSNMLQTIIRNLTSNALKFTPSGGKIILSAVQNREKIIRIMVKDTGIGMSQEIVRNLFNADINVKRAGTNGEKSSGLGLILCREFIEKHEGKLEVKSEKGKGSEFSFTLPCIAERGEMVFPPAIEPIKIKETMQGKLKLLVVEDDFISSKMIGVMVKNITREVLFARTGKEAVQACRLHSDIDLILMDIQMPEVDGYEATRQIREFNKEVVIIAQTALASSKDIEDALSAGCNDHIAKPINLMELNLVIQRNKKAVE